MFTATGWPACRPTRSANAHRRGVAAIRQGGGDFKQSLGPEILGVPAMIPAAVDLPALCHERRVGPVIKVPGGWRAEDDPHAATDDGAVQLAERQDTAGKALIGDALVDAIVRATKADGDSAP